MFKNNIFQLLRHQSASQEIYDPLPALLLTRCYETLGKATSPHYASQCIPIFEVFIQTSQGHFWMFRDHFYSQMFWGQTKAAMLIQ